MEQYAVRNVLCENLYFLILTRAKSYLAFMRTLVETRCSKFFSNFNSLKKQISFKTKTDRVLVTCVFPGFHFPALQAVYLILF